MSSVEEKMFCKLNNFEMTEKFAILAQKWQGVNSDCGIEIISTDVSNRIVITPCY
jgi:hypothetical protein